MRPPSCVRQLADDERTAVEKGLRSTDAGVVRRCPMLVARACGPRLWPALVASVPHGSPSSWAATTRRCSTRCTPSPPRDSPACTRRRPRVPRGPAWSADPPGLRTPTSRAPPRARAPRPARLGQTDQPLDAGRAAARRWPGPPRGVCPPGSAGRPAARPCGAWASAGSAPRTGAPAPIWHTSKNRAARPPDRGGPAAARLVLGFADETWWSRFAQPQAPTGGGGGGS